MKTLNAADCPMLRLAVRDNVGDVTSCLRDSSTCFVCDEARVEELDNSAQFGAALRSGKTWCVQTS